MIVKRNRRSIVPTLALLTLSLAVSAWAQGSHGGHRGHRDAFGPRFEATHDEPRHQPRHRVDSVRHWNEIALIANALDHTPVADGEDRDFGEQLGPCRTSRALAIVHIAIFDAVNAIDGGYKSYTGLSSARDDTSRDAAIAQAAHDTLVALFPSQRASFDERLDEDLGRIRDHREKRNGIHLGRRAAAAILALRADDGSQHAEPLVGIGGYITSDEPGRWRQDPISQIPIALGALWGGVKPFVLQSADQFRAPLPPALDSPEYAAAFNEVKSLGGCGNDPTGCVRGTPTHTERTLEQTTIGIYWGYDGTPSLGTPPRLYNQIAVHIADQRRSDAGELARLLAHANMAMADTCIAVWESKYVYDFWRPVTGIREADAGTGPTGRGDGNPLTDGDLTYTPLGAPASNLKVPTPNFTPPFPAYPSGHAGFGGALFRILRKFYRTDDIAFTFVSDEFNGVTRDNKEDVRPLLPRSFSSLSEAEEENGQSRIYLGIHWAFDKTEGIAQGRQVADYVYDNAFERLHRSHH